MSGLQLSQYMKRKVMLKPFYHKGISDIITLLQLIGDIRIANQLNQLHQTNQQNNKDPNVAFIPHSGYI